MRVMKTLLLFVVPLFFFPHTLQAGAWTLGRGKLWVKTTFLYQKTHDRYYSRITPCPAGLNCTHSGQRVPFPFNGRSRTSAVYLDIQYGLLNQLDLMIQLPFFDISFTDLANPERPGTSELGDVRFGVKYAVIRRPFAGSVKIQAKAPTGFFNKDAEVVPIGDGQWDLEFVGQAGKSLWPIPAYVNLDLGYRLRFKPDRQTSLRDPGNEVTLRAEAGYNILQHVLLKAAINGLFGTDFKDDGLTIDDSERRIVSFEPAVAWSFYKHLTVEALLQVSLSGKNYPAGEVFGVGLSYSM